MDLLRTVQAGNLERVKLLLEAGADVNYKTSKRRTALMWAIAFGNIDICRLLIDHGADLNNKTKDYLTPLMYAVLYNRIELLKLLLSHGANINIQNQFEFTAADIAFNCRNFYAGQILCWRGAKHSKNKTINLLLLFIYCRVIPRDILREIHTKWIS
jgi:ankyrin repeat protein